MLRHIVGVCLALVLLTEAKRTVDDYGCWMTAFVRDKWDMRDTFDAGPNIVFILHNSLAISDDVFKVIKNITDSIIDHITSVYVDDHKSYAYGLGLVTMNAGSDVKMSLGQRPNSVKNHAHAEEFRQVMHSITQSANGTNVGDALTTAESMFRFHSENRILSLNLIILLTASRPGDMKDARDVADHVKAEGISVIAIAVGDYITQSHLDGIGSNGKVTFHVAVSPGHTLKNQYAEPVVQAWKTASVLPRYSLCYQAYIDIFIILDLKYDHKRNLMEVKNFIVQYNLKYVTVRVMIIQSPTAEKPYMELFRSVDRATRGITMEVHDSRVDLASAIDTAKEYYKTEDNSRRLAQNIIMVVTQGSYGNLEDVETASRVCRESGIHVMALGVGLQTDSEELSQIISDPDGVFTVSSAQELKYGLDMLNRNLCPAACDREWVYHDGMCYGKRETYITWLDAKSDCGEFNGNLITLTNAEKEEFFREILFLPHHPRPYTLIGLRKHIPEEKGVMRQEIIWENGQPLIYSNWSSVNQIPDPDGGFLETCTAWYPDGWRDIGCSVQNLIAGWVCEREAGNITRRVRTGVRVQPLWEENVCGTPTSSSSDAILVSGTNCRPAFLPYRTHLNLESVYNCTSGELISKFLLCDGHADCKDESDEKDCGSTCRYDQFQCSNGRCVSLAYTCDFWDDCGDNSDERNCVHPPCPDNTWQCASSQCIAEELDCDLNYDCYDKSDELYCSNMCRQVRCHDGTCIPETWAHDGVVDCGGSQKEDERSSFSSPDLCFSGKYKQLFYLFAADKYVEERTNCTLVYDGHGKHLGTYQDRNCDDDILCPIGFYRCPSSYCIPLETVCDGTMDCVNGEDETGCDDYECPGYFRCPGTNLCMHPAFVCNGENDCPGGRDEVMCNVQCPDGCTCSNSHVTCVHFNHNELNPLDKRSKKVIISGATLDGNDEVFHGLHYLLQADLQTCRLLNLATLFRDQINLQILNMSRCQISSIQQFSLSTLAQLMILDVSFNDMQNISKDTFAGLSSLLKLYLRYSGLNYLAAEGFSHLVKLQVLDLTGNNINWIPDGAFKGLSSLASLHMEGNSISVFGKNVYEGLESLEVIETDEFRLCCPQIRPSRVTQDNCKAPLDAISSCDDLMANSILRVSVWVLSLAAILGNVLTILMRVIWDRKSMKNGFGVFVTHLGMSDFIMGVYLMIIAAADKHYEGQYVWNENEWRRSGFCKLAGFLSTLSSEASTFFICLITLDRFLIIKYPFGQLKFRQKTASIFSAVAWILAVTVAGIPLLPPMNQWNLYTQNGACLALPFSNEKRPGWVYSTVLFIGINFVAFILIALGQYSIYRKMKASSMITSKERSAQEITVARRLLLVVVTDFLCWFPIGVIGIAALSGVVIRGEVYAWIAVFVLPVNSAINPFLYTIPAVLQRMKKDKQQPSSASKYTSHTNLSYVTRTKRIRMCDLEPGMEPLEAVLKKRDRYDRLNLIQGILSSLRDSPDTKVTSFTTSDQSDGMSCPNAVYIGLRGDTVDRICFTTEPNSNINILSAFLVSQIIEDCSSNGLSE